MQNQHLCRGRVDAFLGRAPRFRHPAVWDTGQVKTTLEIDDALLLAAKRAALDRRTTLRALVEAALKKELTAKPGRRRPLKLITHPGGLPPGLDLSSRPAMREWLDADESR